MAKKLISKRLNSKAVINRMRVDSLPYSVFSGNNDILPFGVDNLYPTRVLTAIRKSPTSLGCIKRQSEFIMGEGFANGVGDIVVNCRGETLNDIAWQVIRYGYCDLYGFALHLNFNSLGQICEIFAVNLEYIRKHRDLNRVDYGIWAVNGNSFLTGEYVTVDLYGSLDPLERIAEEGFDKYKGQVLYYSKDSEIYPTSPLDSAIISASYEREAQLYPYSNIKNGFSGNTIIKYPTIAQGEEGQEEIDKITKDLEALHGAENAGHSVVVQVPVGSGGDPKDFKMVENLSPTNIDGLFTNQNAKAENDILKVYNMPKVLLGISDQGMFNAASFNDAFNYKNSDTESDRKAIERVFNKVLAKSCFGVTKTEITPLKMRGQAL